MQAATFSYVTEFHSSDTRNRAASFVSIFFPAIFIFLPVLAWLIIPMEFSFMIFGLNFNSWRLYLICSSSINVLNFVVMSLLPESPKFLHSMGRKEEMMAVLRYMYATNTGNPEEVSRFFY